MESNGKDERVRDEILLAAERVFQKWGLNKTTMEDIAAEAGKGKSTLYYYFRSKETIFEAVVFREAENFIVQARAAASTGGTAKEKIKRYIVSIMSGMKRELLLYGTVRQEIRGNPEVIRRLLTAVREKEEIFVREILLAGIRSGEFSYIGEGESELATKAILGIINALSMYFGLEAEGIDQIEMAARLIANGI
jgi:AcrR family transcriptional regulator